MPFSDVDGAQNVALVGLLLRLEAKIKKACYQGKRFYAITR